MDPAFNIFDGQDHAPMRGAAASSDEALIEFAPSVPWGTALPLSTPGAHGLACRFCLARFGLKAADVGKLPQDRPAWEAHMREYHAGVLA